jgi:hypothetical protein
MILIAVIFKSFQKMNKVSNISSSFDFTEINRDEVLDLLKDLESNTSPGVFGIPVIILKLAKISIVDPLVQILILVLRKIFSYVNVKLQLLHRYTNLKAIHVI